MRILAILIAACVALWSSGCESKAPVLSSDPEVLEFWRRFSEVNSAWLDPKPPAMTYETVLQESGWDHGRSVQTWRDSQVVQTWYAPERNLRFVLGRLGASGQTIIEHEQRYFRGKGNRTSVPQPAKRLLEVRPEQLLAARTGATFLTSLHMIAWWGVPAGAVVEATDADTAVLRSPIPSGYLRWHRDRSVHPLYGHHVAIFSSLDVVPEEVEVTVDRRTMEAKSMVESRDGARTAVIRFVAPWLTLNGRSAPQTIKGSFPGHKRSLVYRFSTHQGIWLLDSLSDVYEDAAPEACSDRRTVVRKVEVGPVPDRMFPNPMDMELPEHAETTLLDGERVLSFKTDDGLVLEGKISMPLDQAKPVPAVFFLPGAGPSTFDKPIQVPDLSKLKDTFEMMVGERKTYNVWDFFARELTRRGVAFFRMNKRGCSIVAHKGKRWEITNRSIFSKATPSVLLADYRAGLDELRRQPDVDSHRIVLLGGSEGTHLAPRLALASPNGIVAIAMFGYAQDNTRDTIVWQTTVGPWRNAARIFDANGDQQITRQEHAEVVQRVGGIIGRSIPFDQLDGDGDGVATPQELRRDKRAERIQNAVQEHDDDFLWENVLCLSSAYLLEQWDAAPNHQTLLRLDMPLAIFHGESDGACRVEGAIETQRAFKRAKKHSLEVKTYPKTDHDLNFGKFLKNGQVPAPYRDLFDYIRSIVLPHPPSAASGSEARRKPTEGARDPAQAAPPPRAEESRQ